MELFGCTLPASGPNCTSSFIDENQPVQYVRVGMLTILLLAFALQFLVLRSHFIRLYEKCKASGVNKTVQERFRSICTYKTGYIVLVTFSLVTGFLFVYFGMLLSVETLILSAGFLQLTIAAHLTSMVCMYFAVTQITLRTSGKNGLGKGWILFSLIFPSFVCCASFFIFIFAFDERNGSAFLQTTAVCAPLIAGFVLLLRLKTGEEAVNILKKHRLRTLELQVQTFEGNELLKHIEKQIRSSINQVSFMNVFWILLSSSFFVPEVNSSPFAFLFIIATLLWQISTFPLLFRSLEAKYTPKSSSQKGNESLDVGTSSGIEAGVVNSSLFPKSQQFQTIASSKQLSEAPGMSYAKDVDSL